MAKDILNDFEFSSNPFIESPKICVICSEAYSEGIIHQKWIDSTLPVEIIRKEIKEMLSESPLSDARNCLKRFLIHDSNGFWSLKIGRFESIENVHDKAMFILERGELGAALLAHCGDVKSAHEALVLHYFGSYDCELEFAVEYFDKNHIESIPEELQSYIDYEAFQEDIFREDFFALEANGRTHVFEKTTSYERKFFILNSFGEKE